MNGAKNLELLSFITAILLFIWVQPAYSARSNISSESFKTPEYYKGGGLDIINAAEAYALGYTGKGITLGMVDQLIRTDHPELAGKAWTYMPSESIYFPDWQIEDHGTSVAGIMVSRKDGLGMHGVAFDASVRNVNLYFSFTNSNLTNDKIYEQLAMRPDIRVINNSWRPYLFIAGIGTVTIDNRADSIDLAMNDRDLSQMLRFSKKHQDTVIVFAAGNESAYSPALSSLVPRYFGAEARNWISVTGLNPLKINRDQDGKLVLKPDALYSCSNLSLGAELWSVMAPAVHIASPDSFSLGYLRGEGTSYAAPQVSAALGLVLETFPWMSAKQLADAVLTTANNDFIVPQVLFQFPDDDFPSFIKIGDRHEFWPLSIDEAIKLLREAFGNSYDHLIPFIEQDNFYAGVMTREQIFGQGILDVGKAVRGIARLDANRMSKEDVYDLRGILAGTNKVALDSFDTQGYLAEFSNDIAERKWDDKYHHFDFQSTAIGESADNAHALAGLSVGLRKTGEGLLILSGTNSYTGPTVVDSGTLSVTRRRDGSGGVLQKSDVLVSKGATLTGDGEISGAVVNMGTVAPGAVVPGAVVPGAVDRILTVGNYTHNSEALLNIGFDAFGEHSALSTTTATLNGGTLQLSPVVGFYSDAVLNMGRLISGSVTGAFAKVNLLSLSPTLNFRLVSASAEGAIVEQERALNAYSQYASSVNAVRVAQVLRRVADVAEGDMQSLLTALDFSAFDGSVVRSALPQLTAIPYIRLAQLSSEANLDIGRMALTQLTTAAGVASRAVNEQSATSVTSAFAMPFAGASVQQESGGTLAHKWTGFIAGMMFKTEQFNMSLYSSLSKRQMDMWTNTQASSNALHFGISALWSGGAGSAWQFWAQSQLGVENTDMSRSVVFADYVRQNNSSYTSFNGLAQLGTAYLWGERSFSFGPKLGLEYSFNTLAATREDGFASRLDINSQTRHDLYATAGLMTVWSKDMGGDRSIQVNLEAVWRQDLLSNPHEISSYFVDYPQYPFNSRLEKEDHSSLGLIAGLELSLKQNLSLNAQVQADILRPKYSNISGALSLRWDF